MRLFCLYLPFIVSFGAVGSAAHAEDHAHTSQKIEFWDRQQKGANFFNAVPTERWFAEAQELGVAWVRLAYEKWNSKQRDFLAGNHSNYKALVPEDLKKLVQVLDYAHKYNIKVVITPLGLPGNRWSQNNRGQKDTRLWKDKKYWRQAAQFWQDLADALDDHPAVYGFNLLNEPTPEYGTDLAENASPQAYQDWYQQHKGSTRDLPLLYQRIITAIRQVDPSTPIMLDAGWYANPSAFRYWEQALQDQSGANDPLVLYSLHMYEPYAYTSRHNFKNKRGYSYPGTVPFGGKETFWDKSRMAAHLQPFFDWAAANKIPANQLVMGEFGCYRRNKNCDTYLTDVIALANSRQIHWAFYAFREDEWDGYDYELGTKGLTWQYWKDLQAGKNPELPRKSTPLFSVIEKEFSAKP